ncbi:MAG: metallophosphoesterase family protein [Bacteroidales bacterium]|jgi:predicted phosphodiesterase|nr:metallophosphoesterase family protein [Bacteroidales bacterium]
MKIAIIADIHEDAVSLKSALRAIEKENCQEIICLGDITGYPFMRGTYEQTRNVSECIEIIKSCCSIVIAGNHDLFHLKKIPLYSGGFEFPSNWFSYTPQAQSVLSGNKVWNYSDDYPLDLSDREIEYLLSLPEYVSTTKKGHSLLLSHSLYPNFTSYICDSVNESIKLKLHFDYLIKNDINISLCGHLHTEGLGIASHKAKILKYNIFTKIKLFDGFSFYPYGKRKLRDVHSCITIPAIADNGQENGFAILDLDDYSINSISLNRNRRFIL